MVPMISVATRPPRGPQVPGLSGKKLPAVFDGYDLIVYGTVQTALAHERGLT